MRLKQIQIYNFGQFSQETFDLPDGNLAAFFGGNEAGKSTTVAFIKQILFGFNLKNTSSVFFEDYEPLTKSYPMGGQLVFTSDEGEYVLERTWSRGDKSKTGAVKVLLNGQEVPVSLFYDQIQNIDGSFYAESFIFNEDLLRQVSSLSEGEILENIYYLGAAQSSQLLAIRLTLTRKPRTSSSQAGRRPRSTRTCSNWLSKETRWPLMARNSTPTSSWKARGWLKSKQLKSWKKKSRKSPAS